MKIHWRIHRNPKVTAYLVGLREEGRGIRQIISLLAVHGIPANAQREGEYWFWEAAGYWIVCVVATEERAISVVEVYLVE